jgi:hypothetical protein
MSQQRDGVRRVGGDKRHVEDRRRLVYVTRDRDHNLATIVGLRGTAKLRHWRGDCTRFVR